MQRLWRAIRDDARDATSRCKLYPDFSILRRVALLALFASLAILTTACEYFPESEFNLADDSRLPKWVSLPPEVKREQIEVTLDYYTTPAVKIKIRNKNTSAERTLKGELLRSNPTGPYPHYSVIRVNGVIDIVEHRAMEPIFYMTDDPVEWQNAVDDFEHKPIS